MASIQNLAQRRAIALQTMSASLKTLRESTGAEFPERPNIKPLDEVHRQTFFIEEVAEKLAILAEKASSNSGTVGESGEGDHSGEASGSVEPQKPLKKKKAS